MKIGDRLFFSPKYPFGNLDFTNSDQIALAFRDRVDGFYLEPAERLIASKDAFAAGLIIFAGIEFLARIRFDLDMRAFSVQHAFARYRNASAFTIAGC